MWEQVSEYSYFVYEWVLLQVRLLCQRSITSVIQSFLDVFLQRTSSYKAEHYFEVGSHLCSDIIVQYDVKCVRIPQQ